MNTFEQIGEAQFLAQQGQVQMAEVLAKLMKRAFRGMVELISRSAPGSFLP